MKANDLKTFFKFNKGQQKGIFLLLTLCIVIQACYFFVDFTNTDKTTSAKQKWLSFQTQIDSLKEESTNNSPTLHSFNPNFITDFKGYKLGMKTEEINRLLAFRKQGKFANSPKEFQEVTGISDSLLKVISPYFKFPNWINDKQQNHSTYEYNKFKKKDDLPILDINIASKEDLMKINGIGEALSERILKQKEVFGGFVSMEQMGDVWGLSPEVIQKLNQSFRIETKPTIKKININTASLKELSHFFYFKYPLSKNIVTYRSMNGDIKFEDLSKIKDFPVDKIKIIALYLDF